MLPKEHGAYGQLGFPLATAFAVGGVSGASVLIAAAAIAGFLAHEPAAVLLGHRGVRAARDRRRAARTALAASTAALALAGAGVLLLLPSTLYWSLLIPLVPAVVLAICSVRGHEKSWLGEVAAAIAFSTVAVPMVLAAGGTLARAATIAVPFALFSVLSTLAVRVVILRVRGGGDPKAAGRTRRLVLVLSALALIALSVASLMGLLPTAMLAAALPGLVIATTVATRPPAATRLRTLGWTLIAASVVTAAIIIGAA